MEDGRRQRSESSTGEDVSHATHIAVSYIDKHYPQYKSVSKISVALIPLLKDLILL